jgi:hypothetical protein
MRASGAPSGTAGLRWMPLIAKQPPACRPRAGGGPQGWVERKRSPSPGLFIFLAGILASFHARGATPKDRKQAARYKPVVRKYEKSRGIPPFHSNNCSKSRTFIF